MVAHCGPEVLGGARYTDRVPHARSAERTPMARRRHDVRHVPRAGHGRRGDQYWLGRRLRAVLAAVQRAVRARVHRIDGHRVQPPGGHGRRRATGRGADRGHAAALASGSRSGGPGTPDVRHAGAASGPGCRRRAGPPGAVDAGHPLRGVAGRLRVNLSQRRRRLRAHPRRADSPEAPRARRLPALGPRHRSLCAARGVPGRVRAPRGHQPGLRGLAALQRPGHTES